MAESEAGQGACGLLSVRLLLTGQLGCLFKQKEAGSSQRRRLIITQQSFDSERPGASVHLMGHYVLI